MNHVAVKTVYNGHPRDLQLRNWPLNTSGRLIQDDQNTHWEWFVIWYFASTHCGHLESLNDAKQPKFFYQLTAAFFVVMMDCILNIVKYRIK